MTQLLKNAVLVDVHAGTLNEGAIGIQNGRFISASKAETDPACAVVDCEGAFLTPGFLDLHGRMPNWTMDGQAALAGGFSSVSLAMGRSELVDGVDALTAMQRRAEQAPCNVLIPGALTIALDGHELAEMGRMAKAGAPFMSQGVESIASSLVLKRAFEYAQRLNLQIFIRGGDPDLEQGGVVRAGPWAVVHGLPMVPPEAEEIGVFQVAALARQTGARVHLTHLWSALGVSALRKVASETPNLTASTTVHHLTINHETLSPYSGQSRFLPPLGNEADQAALVTAIKDGLITGVATDHSPHPPRLKTLELEAAAPGSVAFECALPLVLEALEGDVLLACRALSYGPRQILGLEERPFVKGQDADLVLFNSGGQWVHKADELFASQKNTPIDGRVCIGRVKKTWVKGQLAFEACETDST